MKKKALGKLTLSRQTISNLQNNDMQQVKGGYITYTCPAPFACDTNEIECTIRHCGGTEYSVVFYCDSERLCPSAPPCL